jgi:hypothetical protein
LTTSPLRRLVPAPRGRDRHEGEDHHGDELEPVNMPVGLPTVVGPLRHRVQLGRMLIARATTRIAVSSETIDCSIIVIFAHVVTGNVSVGLNAVEFVNAR